MDGIRDFLQNNSHRESKRGKGSHKLMLKLDNGHIRIHYVVYFCLWLKFAIMKS